MVEIALEKLIRHTLDLKDCQPSACIRTPVSERGLTEVDFINSSSEFFAEITPQKDVMMGGETQKLFD